MYSQFSPISHTPHTRKVSEFCQNSLSIRYSDTDSTCYLEKDVDSIQDILEFAIELKEQMEGSNMLAAPFVESLRTQLQDSNSF